MARKKKGGNTRFPFQILLGLIQSVCAANNDDSPLPKIQAGLLKLEAAMASSSQAARQLAADLLKACLIVPKRTRQSDEFNRLLDERDKSGWAPTMAALKKYRVLVKPAKAMLASEEKVALGVRIIESVVQLERLKVESDVYHDAALNMFLHLVAGEPCHG